MSHKIDYRPPKTIAAFIKDYRPGKLFYDWIVGPVGSAKTTGIFFKLVYMAKLQAKGRDGIRHSRAVVVRNTMPQLRDTTINSWNIWFKHGQAGEWHASQNRFVLRFDDVECEVLFRPLDTAEDVARVLSLEVTFAIIDEFVQVPRAIVDALSARLGRYPSAQDGGATNWGMWGSSNPDTEDNWWFDYLHNDPSVERYDPNEHDDARFMRHKLLDIDPPARFFTQPSGFSAEAENIENLPGGAAYYTAQAVGKSLSWVKQFLEAEWGFSASGKPVIPIFNAAVHVSKTRLAHNPIRPIIMGLDPGLGGTAVTFGQEDHHGRLLVFGEVIASNIGTDRFISDVLKPYIRRRGWQDMKFIVAPDPAAANRAQTDEKTVVDRFKRHWEIKIESNNRLPLRIDAINHFAGRLTDMGMALQIDPEECPILTRALKGGWRFELNPKQDGQIRSPTPEKNKYSHPGDSLGYLARYFHRQNEREMRYSGQGARTFQQADMFANTYHAR